jgi:hypothetical protein
LFLDLSLHSLLSESHFPSTTSSLKPEHYVSAFLTQGDTILFYGPGRSSTFTLSLLYNRGVSDGIINNATGFVLDFEEEEASSQRKSWHFELTHYRLGLQDNSTGGNYTRFVDTVSGGQVGGTVY